MKKIKWSKKLNLNKQVISELNDKKKTDIVGGYPTPFPSWRGRCTKRYDC